MPRNIRHATHPSTNIIAHLAGAVTTVCLCWKLLPQGAATGNRLVTVTWTNIAGNLRKEGNTLVCNGTGFDSWGARGASSSEAFTGEGELRFTRYGGTSHFYCGLSSDDAAQTRADIDFAWFISGAEAQVREADVLKAAVAITDGESYWTIRRVWDGTLGRHRIDYLMNDEVKYTSAATPAASLRADTAFSPFLTSRLAEAVITQPNQLRAVGFTSHTKDLVLSAHSNLRFVSKRGMRPSTAEQQSGLAAPNIEVDAIFSDDGIRETDVHAGVWDAADYECFLVNYKDTTQGELVLQSGRVGELRQQGLLFKAEGLGLAARVQQQVGDLTLGTCRVRRFAGPGCNIAGGEAAYTTTGYVTAVSSALPFLAFTDSNRTQAAGFFAGGDLKFTSGKNKDFETEVRQWNEGATKVFVLHQPAPYLIEVGATYSVVQGCDRSPETCEKVFNNKINFQGEDTIPGIEAVVRRPDVS